ncbi:hypothetical protein [Pirellula sp. SH-Sr6A]|uniref:hypothetical protein n=1 Tax=Pirellula sp. SH-Sr6A TaxID=1632865 RepID=UPI0011BACD1C|nr:hypothetical protein [Pirellula sp. SH-Sr6A]
MPTTSAKAIQSASASQTGTVSRETLLDYLQTAAKSMRRLELGIGVVLWLTGVLMLIVLAVFVDHWVAPLPRLARLLFCAAIVFFSLWWIPKRVFPLLLKPIHPEHAARKIESLYPGMKESLISWLQLSTADDPTPRGVLAVVGRFAARNLHGADSGSVLDTGSLLKWTTFFVTSLLAFLIYSFAAPKSSVVSLARILMPFAAIDPASRVQILEVSPGSTTITQGTNLIVSVSTRGMYKQDEVHLRYDLSDGQKVGQRVKLKPEIEGLSYSVHFGEGIGGLHQPFTYWIEAGDAVEGPFDVKIQTVPLIAIDRLQLQFPPYTKLKDRTILKDGSCEVPEGTRVQLFAHANQPLAKARIEFNPVLERGILLQASSLLDLKVQTTELHGDWLALLNEEKSSPTLHRYRIKGTNTLGEQNSDPVIYQLKVLADIAPTVNLASDVPASIEVPEDQPLDLEFRARDPDYGLASLRAIVHPLPRREQATPIANSTLFETETGTIEQVLKSYRLSPRELGLRTGDRVEVFAVATDNRRKPGTDTLEPNERESSHIEVKVVAATARTETKDPKDAAKEPPKTSDLTKPQDPKGNGKGNPTKQNDQKGKNNNSGASGGQESSGAQTDSSQSGAGGGASGEESTQGKGKGKGTGQGGSSGQSGNSDSTNEGGQGTGQGGSNASGTGSSSSGGNQSATSQPSGSQGAGSGDPQNDASSGSESSEPNGSESGSESGGSSGSQSGSQGGSQSGTQNGSNATSPSTPSGDESGKSPEHDGEAFDAINEYRQQREQSPTQSGDQSGGESGGESSPQTGGQPGESGQQRQPGQPRPPQPVTNQPGTNQPGTNQPGTNQPGTNQPGANQPGANQPGANQPGANQPGANQPGANQPGANQPGANQPGANQPGANQPGANQPGANQPGANQPGANQPGANQPGANQPGANQPGANQPGGESGSKSGGQPGQQSQPGQPSPSPQSAGEPGANQPGGESSSQSGSPDSSSQQNPGPKAAPQPGGESGSQSGGQPGQQSQPGQPRPSPQSAGEPGTNQPGGESSSQSGSPDSSSQQNPGPKAAPQTGGESGSESGGQPGQPSQPRQPSQPSPSPQSAGEPGANQPGGESSSQSGSPDSSSQQNPGPKAAPQTGGESGSQSGGQPGQPGQPRQPSPSPQSAGDPGANQPGGSPDNPSSSQPGAESSQPSGSQPSSQPGSDSATPSGESQSASEGGKPSDRGNISGNMRSATSSNAGVVKSDGRDVLPPRNPMDTTYADKQTDLALQYLKEQRDQPDPELLRKLNWSKEDMQRFIDRWSKAKEEARTDPDKKRDLDAALRSLGLKKSGSKVQGTTDQDDQLRGYLEDGSRVRPPESLRERLERFRKAANRIE